MANLLKTLSFAILPAALLLAGQIASAAQSGRITTPAAGSAERKAIMDALRVPIEKQLHQKTIFVVSKLKVQGNWAFAITKPQQPNGKPIDYQKTAFRDEVKPGESVGDAFSGIVVGLMRKRSGHWKTVDYCIGPSDVCWDGWDKKYGAPRGIMRSE